MSWAARETETANLGDRRLNKRMTKLLDRALSATHCEHSSGLPGLAGDAGGVSVFRQSEGQGRERVGPASRGDARAHGTPPGGAVRTGHDGVGLIAGKARPRGLGPLTYETQRGLYLHPTLAVTPERLCLGVLDALIWARSDEGYGKSEERKQKSDRGKGECALD